MCDLLWSSCYQLQVWLTLSPFVIKQVTEQQLIYNYAHFVGQLLCKQYYCARLSLFATPGGEVPYSKLNWLVFYVHYY